MEKSKNLIVLSGTILSIRENKKNTVLIVKSKGESKEANVEFVFYDTSVLKGITPKMKVKIRAHGENRKSERICRRQNRTAETDACPVCDQ